MTAGDKALSDVWTLLNAAEFNLELANALTPEDRRLNEAELILHKAISEINRIRLGLPR